MVVMMMMMINYDFLSVCCEPSTVLHAFSHCHLTRTTQGGGHCGVSLQMMSQVIAGWPMGEGLVCGSKYLEAVEAGEKMLYIGKKSPRELLISSVPLHLMNSFYFI